MLLIHNGVPTPVTHKIYSVNGFVRVFHKFTGKYLTSLPAAMVRRKSLCTQTKKVYGKYQIT